MNTHVEPREDQTHARANVVSGASRRSSTAGSSDAVQRSEGAIASGRPRAAQLREYQRLSSRNPEARQLLHLREVMNRRATPGAGSQTAAPVQRRVTIGGQQVDSVVDAVGDNWPLLSLEAAEAAGWMRGLSPTWDFADPEYLLLFANRVAAMTKLIRSIFATGILSRERLAAGGIPFVGSEDVGNAGKLAVNVLDNRVGGRTAASIADESMIAQDRGSISVAFERENDWIKQGPDDDEFGEWTKPQHVALTDQETREVTEMAGGNPALAEMITRHRQQNTAFARNEALLNGLYSPEMNDRAQNTLMAVVPRPDSMAVLSPRDLSYESEAPGGQIVPGQGGFTTLLIPQWYQPFYLMLRQIQPPGVTVRFVGNTQVTAFYKSPLGQIPVTVDAPDYASEVGPELQQFRYLATHILTADPLR